MYGRSDVSCSDYYITDNITIKNILFIYGWLVPLVCHGLYMDGGHIEQSIYYLHVKYHCIQESLISIVIF